MAWGVDSIAAQAQRDRRDVRPPEGDDCGVRVDGVGMCNCQYPELVQEYRYIRQKRKQEHGVEQHLGGGGEESVAILNPKTPASHLYEVARAAYCYLTHHAIG